MEHKTLIKDEDYFLDLQLGSKKEIANLLEMSNPTLAKKKGALKLQKEFFAVQPIVLGAMKEVADDKQFILRKERSNLESQEKQYKAIEEKEPLPEGSMFLSDGYRELYDLSRKEMEKVGQVEGEQEYLADQPGDKRMLKVGQKMYKQQWLLEKLAGQQERKKKTRGLKRDPKAGEERKNTDQKQI